VDAADVTLVRSSRMGDHSLGLADEALDDRPATPEPMFYTGADGTTADSKTTSPTANSPANGSNVKTRVPMQKRRRVTRACDECRRKKIKCDGKQPCTHCTVYSYGRSAHGGHARPLPP